MKISLRKLEQFTVVAQLGSFTRAAEKLGLSQPALSRSLAEIEASFGMRLLDRSRSGIHLTPAGQALQRDAQRLLSDARAIEESLEAMASGAGGSVTFGMGPLIGALILTQLLGDIARAHAALSITALVSASEKVALRVAAGEFEFGLVARSMLHGTEFLEVESIGLFRLGFFCRAGHPLASEGVVKQSNLVQFPVCTGSGSDLPLPAGPGIFCDDFHVLKDVMLGSDAIWLTADRLVIEELAAGSVVALDAPWTSLSSRPVEIALIKPRARTMSAAADIVINRLRILLA